MKNIAIDPYVAPVLATLPASPERDQLTESYTTALDAWTATRKRSRDLAQRTNAIVVELLDASPKQREALLAEQATNAVEQALLPRLLTERSHRLADAFNAWTRGAKRDLAQAIRDVQNEIAVLSVERQPQRRILWKADQSTAMAQHLATETAKAREVLSRTLPALQELQRRETDLQRAVSHLNVAISNAFGEHARNSTPRADDIARFVKRIERPAA